jgi:N-methylhydantoinase A
VYFPEAGGFTATPVYDRYRLVPGARLSGPAVVEERESTAVVPPGAEALIDPHWNLVISLPPATPPRPTSPKSEVRSPKSKVGDTEA